MLAAERCVLVASTLLAGQDVPGSHLAAAPSAAVNSRLSLLLPDQTKAWLQRIIADITWHSPALEAHAPRLPTEQERVGRGTSVTVSSTRLQQILA